MSDSEYGLIWRHRMDEIANPMVDCGQLFYGYVPTACDSCPQELLRILTNPLFTLPDAVGESSSITLLDTSPTSTVTATIKVSRRHRIGSL